jgi:GNAT superfamily N-acetyltransferase
MGILIMTGVLVRAGLPIQLSDDLVLRQATERDRDALAELQAVVHAGSDGKPSVAIGTWTSDLFDYEHPTMDLADIAVVEDKRAGALVSSLILVRQTWSYAGVPFGVGRLELVATHPDYRRRGLISRQLKALHDRSVAGGDLLQVITDLMFFHEEFGYHMALTQRAGRGGHAHELPPMPKAGEPAGLQPATPADIPTLINIDRHAQVRSLLSCLRDEKHWKHELTGRSRESMMCDKLLIIHQASKPVGYIVLGYGGIPSFPIPGWLPGLPCPEQVVSIAGFELLPGTSWQEVASSVLRQLTGEAGYMLWLGREHPVYSVLANLLVRRPPHMGWFLRVPDLVQFLSQVAPVLERRLSGSDASGFTGTLRLHFYTQGLLLRFSEGGLTGVERWPEHSRRDSDASMPVQMFLQLLFGHAKIAEIASAFPDCRIQTRLGETLLPVLFPKQSSHIWPFA